MTGHDFLNILSAIVTVALVTTVVGHKNSAHVISASGNAFSQSVSSALGGGVGSGYTSSKLG